MSETTMDTDERYYQQVENGAESDENQNENLVVMGALLRKYPNAFINDIDGKGRPFSRLKDTDSGVNVVCPRGLVLIDGGTDWNQSIVAGKVDLTNVFDGHFSGKASQMLSVEVRVESDNGHKANVIMPYCVSDFQNANWPYLNILFDRTEESYEQNDTIVSQISELAMDLTVRIV